MVTEADPIEENWYQHLDKGQMFKVITIDDEHGLIEIQHYDGDLEEIELAHWRLMELEPIEEPENWDGAMDVEELDDLSSSVTDTSASDWLEPLDEIGNNELFPEDKEALEDEEALEDVWDEDSSLEERGEEE